MQKGLLETNVDTRAKDDLGALTLDPNLKFLH